MDQVKPSYKTMEFWINAVVTVVGLVMASGLIGTDSQAARIIGGVMAILAPLIQTASRTQIKTAWITTPDTLPAPEIPGKPV